MLDVLIPVPLHNLDLFDECVSSLEACTDFSFNTVISLDGPRNDKIIKRAQGLRGPWRLVDVPKPAYLNNCIGFGLGVCRNQFVAIVAPHIRVTDEQWFSKAKHIFDRDSAAAVVIGEPHTKSATVAPFRLTRRDATRPGCQLAILKRSFASGTPPQGDIDPIEHYVKLALRTGHQAWSATGIRYTEVQHKKHERWREPSVKQERSASQSQMMQD